MRYPSLYVSLVNRLAFLKVLADLDVLFIALPAGYVNPQEDKNGVSEPRTVVSFVLLVMKKWKSRKNPIQFFRYVQNTPGAESGFITRKMVSALREVVESFFPKLAQKDFIGFVSSPSPRYPPYLPIEPIFYLPLFSPDELPFLEPACAGTRILRTETSS